jgi:hypothetical protein
MVDLTDQRLCEEPGAAWADQPPLTYPAAARALAGCTARAAALLWRRRMHLPSGWVGTRLRFADGTCALVYRETVIDYGAVTGRCALVMTFTLRAVRGRGHAAFRRESLLNTVLFAGFPGFVSKLWLANDLQGRYRGVYEWDGPEQADRYARALWRVLALVSVPGSVHYIVLPGLARDDFVRDPAAGQAVPAPGGADTAPPGAASGGSAWWRVTGYS